MSLPTAIDITIDVGPAVHQSAGLSRYTDRLIEHLAPDPQLDLSLFYNSHSNHHLPEKFSNLRYHTIPMGQYQWRLGALLSQFLGLPRLGRSILPQQSEGRSTLYHATEHLLPRLGCPSVLTVHDLIFERFPEHHTLRNRLFLKMAMPTFVRAADIIIAVSQHSKKDLLALYGTPADKVVVIYEGVDERFHPHAHIDQQEVVERAKAQYSPTRPYLLMVGTLEPRKNHATAIRAMARLMAADTVSDAASNTASAFEHQLLIVGGQGWLFDPIKALVSEMALEDRVSFAGYVPDADLPALYAGASAVLVPSLYEGFGFSVLEAMACGAPVIASNVSSLGEVAGDAALPLVNPHDDEALAALIGQLLSEPALAEDLVERGIRQAAKFNWSDTARQTADLYLSLHHINYSGG